MSKPASHNITIWVTCSQAEIHLFKIVIPLSESPPVSLFYALRKLGMNPESTTNSAALAIFRFRNWLAGFGLIIIFFSLIGEGRPCLRFTFSSLLCSMENFRWICSGADPFLYFSQHSLGKELLGLDPRCKGLSLFPGYPALLHWYPGPPGLQARPLALNAFDLPIEVFFISSISSSQFPSFTTYHIHSSSSI